MFTRYPAFVLYLIHYRRINNMYISFLPYFYLSFFSFSHSSSLLHSSIPSPRSLSISPLPNLLLPPHQLRSLKTIFTAAIQKAFPQVMTEEFGTGIITRCGNPSFGDFQCNNSLSIAKYFKTLSDYSGMLSVNFTSHHTRTHTTPHHTQPNTTPHNLNFSYSPFLFTSVSIT
jgi:Arginyl tRNA synthetase N terminal domain